MTDRVALVTGASRGIGRAIALKLGQQGFTVVGTATTEVGAENISAFFKEQGIAGIGMSLNVTDLDSINTVVSAVKEQYGAPVVLVNNAGITKDNILMRMKDEEWTDVVDTNLSSIYRLSKACVRGMTKGRWGRIINISSVVGSMGNAGQSNYAAAKAGMEGFSRALAKELGSRNVTVNCVAPGFIESDMTAALDQDMVDGWKKAIPLKRGGQPSEVADACVFLGSDMSSYISGQTLNVCGAMLT